MIKQICSLCISLVLYYSLAQGSLESITLPDGTQGSIDWTSSGQIQATGRGFPIANPISEAQEELTACRGAEIVAKSNLLELASGIFIEKGISVKEAASDPRFEGETITGRVSGMVRGAAIIREDWNAEKKQCDVEVSAALEDLRNAIPPLELEQSFDINEFIIIAQAFAPQPESTPTPTENMPIHEATQPPASTDTTQATPGPAPTPSPQPAPATPLAATDDTIGPIQQGGTISQNVLTNDSYNPQQPPQITLVGNVSSGTLSLSPDGTFTYTHNGSASTSDAFKYSLGNGVEAFVHFSITPNPVSAQPAPTPQPTEQTQTATPTPTPEPTPQASPPATTPPEPQSESGVATEAPNQSKVVVPEGQGGPVSPTPVVPQQEINAEAVTGIILDASTYPVTRSMLVNISDNLGIHVAKIKVSYEDDSVDQAKNHKDVTDQPIVFNVYAVSTNKADLMLTEEDARKFQNLLEEKDFAGHILIVRKKD